MKLVENNVLTSALMDYRPFKICEFDGAKPGDVKLTCFLVEFYSVNVKN
jgi:hypothetical protein